MFWSSSHLIKVLVFAALLLPGCALTTPRPSAPAWAIHLKPSYTAPAADIAQLKPRLIQELAVGHYEVGQTSPEQLACLALSELDRGNMRDAAVILSLASYRRIEQSFAAYDYALNSALQVARTVTYGRLDESAYKEYVGKETKTIFHARFDDEIERTAASLGEALKAESAQEDVLRVVMGNLHDEYGAMDALKQRAQANEQDEPEQLAHEDLAQAVRVYLEQQVDNYVADPDTRPFARMAVQYLAKVPVRTFRLAALRVVTEPFEGLVLRATARLHRKEPGLVVGELKSERAETRGVAALTLGVLDDLPSLPALETAHAAESDSYTQLSISFALARLGEKEHLRALQKGLHHADAKIVQHALTLVHWLPPDVEATLRDEELVRVMHGRDLSLVGRFLGVLIMRDISTRRALSQDAINTLVQMSRQMGRSPSDLTIFSRAFASIEQLDRKLVLDAIRKERQPVEPWMERFAHVAQKSDLPLLESLRSSSSFEGDKQVLLVKVASSIPGPEAQAQLERWFREDEGLRNAIAVQLVLRSDVDKARLRALAAEVRGPQNMFFALALGDSAMEAPLRGYLENDDATLRYSATLAVKLFGGPQHAELLRPNINYYDDRYYPGDLELRQLTLGALIDLELNRRRPQNRPVSQPEQSAQPVSESARAPLAPTADSTARP